MPQAPVWEKPNPKHHHKHLTGVQKKGAKQWAKRHHIPYPSFVQMLMK